MKFVTPKKILKLQDKYNRPIVDCPVQLHDETICLAIQIAQDFDSSTRTLAADILFKLVQQIDHDSADVNCTEMYYEIIDGINKYKHADNNNDLYMLWLHTVAYAHNTLVLGDMIEGKNK